MRVVWTRQRRTLLSWGTHMHKAMVGVFADRNAADLAISRLREHGFLGEHIVLGIRDAQEGRGQPRWARVPRLTSLHGGFVGLIAGIVVGLLVALSFSALGAGLSVTGLVVFAVLGGIVGLVSGLVMGALASAAVDSSLDRLWQSLSRRPEFVVSVPTDEQHAPKARELMEAAGALDLRRGGVSEAREFALKSRPVAPDNYGPPPVIEAPTQPQTLEGSETSISEPKLGEADYVPKDASLKR